MTDADVVRLIQREIRQQLNIILSGEAENASQDGAGNYAEDIQALFPGMTGIPQRPVMHPYGFASLAPAGTIQVTARQGEHCGNRLILGHRAADRPTTIVEGEAAAYSGSGYTIQWKQGSIMIGKGTDLEPLVLGETLNTFLTNLLNKIIAHTHASPGSPPANIADFQSLLTGTLNANKILVQDGGGT